MIDLIPHLHFLANVRGLGLEECLPLNSRITGSYEQTLL